MTSSDEARALLARVTTLLAEEHLQQHIDDPITRACDSFECPPTPEYSETEFRHLIADFWRHVWRQMAGQDPGLTVAWAKRSPCWRRDTGARTAMVTTGR